ncbi:MAG: tetraacyldisaccharide 4'-kinase [Campylobacterales bacterium]|nr:tetraacyldisaccharide 4'-kinase [Campylobacterales bacterium]
MKQLITFIENYFYYPTPIHKLLSLLLLPLTTIYMLIILLKKKFAKPIDYGIPIISVGNIIIGGSGKTPFVISLAKRYKNSCIILRGYKRKSKGLIVVSNNGNIECDVNISGDEAMEYALKVPTSSVIVSEDRTVAIQKAKEIGCKMVLLDDGHSKYNIQKFDILLKSNVEPKNRFCIPSGPFREPYNQYNNANLVAIEDCDYKRVVTIDDIHENMVFITAIANPKRIFKYLPKNIKIYTYEDHHFFTKDEIATILKESQTDTILTTFKDFVKIKEFGFKICLINLELEINQHILNQCDEYINQYIGDNNYNFNNRS